MKEWSKAWKASKLPKKQRKYVYNLPLHLRSKLLSSRLSEELTKKYNMRNIRVRKGDKATIMRGQNKGKTGTIEGVNTTDIAVYVSGISLTKRDGSKTNYPIHPSNIMITELSTDKRRLPSKKVVQAEHSSAGHREGEAKVMEQKK